MPTALEDATRPKAGLLHLLQRSPLVTAPCAIALIKSIEFLIDSQALFYDDSGSFLLNALTYAFVPERSYVYGWLIRVFALPLHSLRAIVATQMVMGAITCWLLALVLVRYLKICPWMAMLAACVMAIDPTQVVHEHLIMTESMAIFAEALFLVAALEYLRQPDVRWLLLLGFLGGLLVGIRTVYVPVVLAASVLLPAGAYFAQSRRNARALVIAIVVSCGSMLLFQLGYRQLTGWLAGREPAYHYRAGFFSVGGVAPLIQERDATDPRVAAAIREQNASRFPLANPGFRAYQVWSNDGFVARITRAFQGHDAEANEAAGRLVRTAILRDPLAYLRLAGHTYAEYWTTLPRLRHFMFEENGTGVLPAVSESEARMVKAIFGEDISNQPTFQSPSRRYQVLGRYWNVFLLASPFLGFLTLWLKCADRKASTLLFVWSVLVMAATCLLGIEVVYRYLHPLSFTGLAAAAVVAESGYDSLRRV